MYIYIYIYIRTHTHTPIYIYRCCVMAKPGWGHREMSTESRGKTQDRGLLAICYPPLK